MSMCAAIRSTTRPGRKMARPADVARDADSPLVNRALEPAQAGVVAGERRPVVGQEDNDRRVGETLVTRTASSKRPTLASMFVTIA